MGGDTSGSFGKYEINYDTSGTFGNDKIEIKKRLETTR